ncbi:MAG: NAAT family transporter [Bacteriovoracaceae bacterium]|nr:NAAT family transporter [Bacteriovoracaceae bacterium]
METAIDHILKYGITLFTIINPLGIIPIFLGMTKDHGLLELKKISKSCSIAVIITLIVSLVIGQKIINFFGISIASFRIGGGLLIFTMAFSMISAKASAAKINRSEIREQEASDTELGIVPLAIPLLAGPGAISTSIIHAQRFNTVTHWLGAIGVIVTIGLFILLSFRYSRKIGERIGVIGLNVLTRIMGIILLALSIEMIAGGIKEILPVLKGIA